MNIFEKIKGIPILDIAAILGIEPKGNGQTRQTFCFNGHDKKTPSLTFYIKSNSFHCFGCNASGSVFDLVMQILNTTDKKSVLNWFENYYNISDNSVYPISHINRRKNSVLDADVSIEKIDKNKSKAIYKKLIESLPLVEDICYLTSDRCLPKDILNAAGVRQIPKGYDFKTALKEFDERQLFDSGLTADGSNGRYFVFYSCEFLFPFFDSNGNILYLQGIAYPISKPNQESKRLRFNLKNNNDCTPKPALYLPRQFLDYKTDMTIFIVEGVIDCLSLLALGWQSVAIPDANVSSGNSNQLEILKPFKISCMGDYDIAGIRAMRRIQHIMTTSYNKYPEILNIRNAAKDFGIVENDLMQIKDSNDILKQLK